MESTMRRTTALVTALLLAVLPPIAEAQIKISGLPTATTPLTGAEIVPAVQAGTTKQATLNAVATLARIGPQKDIVKDYAADPTGAADSRTAFFNANAAELTHEIPAGTYKIASNLTLGNTWRFDQGAVLVPSTGVTITFTGVIDAPPTRIFDTSASSAKIAGAPYVTLRGAPPQWWGAKGDDSTADDAPIAAAFAFVKQASKTRFWLPGAIYKVGCTTFDFASLPNGMVMDGDGVATSILDARTCNSGPAVLLTVSGGVSPASVATDYVSFTNIGIYANVANAGLQYGGNNFYDALNEFQILTTVQNFSNSASAIGCKSNYFLGAHVFQVCDVAGSGVGCELDQSSFVHYEGSCGSGVGVGTCIKITNGFNIGNVIPAFDKENCATDIVQDSATSSANTVVSGQWNYYTNGVNAPLGNNLYIENPSLAPSAPATAATFVAAGTTAAIIHTHGLIPVTTPTFPLTTVAVTNTTGMPIIVQWWGGSVTAISINGGAAQALATGTTILNPNDTITPTYTGSPSWLWRQLN